MSSGHQNDEQPTSRGRPQDQFLDVQKWSFCFLGRSFIETSLHQDNENFKRHMILREIIREYFVQISSCFVKVLFICIYLFFNVICAVSLIPSV